MTTTGQGMEFYTWHGLCGAYPVPERFHNLLRNRAPASRREALRQLGDFYHWLHQQECTAMAAAESPDSTRHRPPPTGAHPDLSSRAINPGANPAARIPPAAALVRSPAHRGRGISRARAKRKRRVMSTAAPPPGSGARSSPVSRYAPAPRPTTQPTRRKKECKPS